MRIPTRVPVLALSVLLAGCATAPSQQDGGGGPSVDGSRVDAMRLPDGMPPRPPDASNPPDADLTGCELYPQSGCPAGWACDLDPDNLSAGGTDCREVTSPGRDTSSCSTMGECASGFVCLGSDLASSCKKYCDVDGDCGAAYVYCLIQVNDGSGNPIPGATVCTSNCTPMTSSGCPTGWGCQIYKHTDNTLFKWCIDAGSGGQEASCTTDGDCLPNYTCVNVGTGGDLCLKWCSPPGSGSCPSGYSCIGFDPVMVVGATEYGVCW